MSKRRYACMLMVLVLVVLLCALAPAAFADELCTCQSAQNPDPECRCGCNGDSRSARRDALEEFLVYTMAAENEKDPAIQAELYRESVKLWDRYMDIVLRALSTELAAKEEPSAPGEVIGSEECPTDIYLTYDDVQEPAPAQESPAVTPETGAEEKTQGVEPQSVQGQLLEKFLLAMRRAEAETDPVRRDAYYAQAEMLWNEYMYSVTGANGPDMYMEGQPRKEHRHEKTKKQDAPATDTAPVFTAPMETPAAPETAASLSNRPEDIDVYLSEPLFDNTVEQGMTDFFGIPNPWTETDTLEEAIWISGVDVRLPGEEKLPQKMELLRYQALPGTIEADYSNGEEELMIRASLDEEGYILSGDYNTYSREWEEEIGGLRVDCLGDGKHINVAMFRLDDTAYALTMACGREGFGLTAEELAAIVEDMLPKTEADIYTEQTDIYADPVDIYADPKPVQLLNEMEKPEAELNGEIMVLYTGDVRCGIDEGFGYAGLKALRDSLEAQGYITILVDGGNAVQGAAIGELSGGEAIIDLMNALAYDVAVPGELELAFGAGQFGKLARSADFPYISCNFTLDEETVLEPYVIVEADGKRIAFIGLTVSGDTGRVAAALQNTVSSARMEGAEIVYVIAHTDVEAGDSPLAADIVANTIGIDVYFDNNGGDTAILSDRMGNDVVYVSCSPKLSGIGYSRINGAGAVVENGTWLWPNGTSAAMLFGVDNDISEMVQAAYEKLDMELNAQDDAESEQETAVMVVSGAEMAALEGPLTEYLAANGIE